MEVYSAFIEEGKAKRDVVEFHVTTRDELYAIDYRDIHLKLLSQNDRRLEIHAYSFSIVLIGRHLRELYTALNLKYCPGLVEYDERWPLPGSGVPVIQHMVVDIVRMQQTPAASLHLVSAG